MSAWYSNVPLVNLPNCGKTPFMLSTTTYSGKLRVILAPVMEVASMVKTSITGITGAAKSLKPNGHGMCSEAIENYIR